MANRTIVIMALVAWQISTFAYAQSTFPAKPQFEAWKSCISNKAQRYAKSSGPAEAAAKVAMTACRPERAKFWDGMIADHYDFQAQQHLMSMLEATLLEEASVQIMELRTAK